MQEPLSTEPANEPALGVLLVEDNPADARLVEEELRAHEALSLVWVKSLAEAQAALVAHRFDAVLLDLLLPDARGVDLIDSMQAHLGDAALVVLSGQSPDDLLLARAAIRKGAEDFLPKGVRAPHLLPRTITTAIERRRRAQAARLVDRPGEAVQSGALAAGGEATWRYCPKSGGVVLSAGAVRLLGLDLEPGGLALAELWPVLPPAAGRTLLRLWHRLQRGAAKASGLLFDDAPPQPGMSGQDTLIEARVRRDPAGAIVAVEGALFDVTAARRLDRLHDSIISQLGHELRTPLTTIRAALGLLHGDAGDPLPHGSAGLLRRAVSNADRLAALIDELLAKDSAVPPSRRPPATAERPSPASLAAWVASTVAGLQAAAAAAGTVLRCGTTGELARTVASDLPDWTGADGGERSATPPPGARLDVAAARDLELLLTALVLDAIRSTGEGGEVLVELAREQRWIWLTVRLTAGAAGTMRRAPADGTPADGAPADGTPANRTPAEGTPAGGTPAAGARSGRALQGRAPEDGAARGASAPPQGAVAAGRADLPGEWRCRRDLLERLSELIGGRLAELPDGPAGAWRLALPLVPR